MANSKSAISLGISAVIVIALILIVGFGLFLDAALNPSLNTTYTKATDITPISSPPFLPSVGGCTNTATMNSESTTTTMTCTAVATSSSSSSSPEYSTVCSISGQPAGIFLRILNSASTPVIGAQVMATNQPALCEGSPATKQTTLTFTTTSAEWYPFVSENNAGYSFFVSYSGQNYNFTASLRPVSVTCATLIIPSGKTNITITEFQSTCTSSTTTTSSFSAGAQIVLQVKCCITLPQSFSVGSYSIQDFQYAPPPAVIVTTNGTTTERFQSAGVLLIFEVTSGHTSQNVSFTWGGTFSETVPSPSSASAFNGNVNFLWYTNSTSLYVEVNVNG